MNDNIKVNYDIWRYSKMLNLLLKEYMKTKTALLEGQRISERVEGIGPEIKTFWLTCLHVH